MDYGKHGAAKGNGREPRPVQYSNKGAKTEAQQADEKKALLERMKAAAAARKK